MVSKAAIESRPVKAKANREQTVETATKLGQQRAWPIDGLEDDGDLLVVASPPVTEPNRLHSVVHLVLCVWLCWGAFGWREGERDNKIQKELGKGNAPLRPSDCAQVSVAFAGPAVRMPSRARLSREITR